MGGFEGTPSGLAKLDLALIDAWDPREAPPSIDDGTPDESVANLVLHPSPRHTGRVTVPCPVLRISVQRICVAAGHFVLLDWFNRHRASRIARPFSTTLILVVP
jgi:hypothetical protein